MGTIFVLSMVKQMLLHISQSIIDLDEAYGSGLAMTGAEAGRLPTLPCDCRL